MTTMIVGLKANPAASSGGIAELTTARYVWNRNVLADGDGIATIELPGLDVSSIQGFKVYESIKIYSDSANDTIVTIYENEASPQFFVGGSDQGNLNEWSENPPLYTDKKLIIQWTGCVEGDTCFARIQFSEVVFVPVRV